MGLIMLILVGTVPTAYALNHAVTAKDSQKFVIASSQAADAISHYISPTVTVGDAEPELEKFVSSKKYQPSVMLALEQEITNIRNEVTAYGTLKSVPAAMQANVRNQMYLTSETFRLLPKAAGSPKFSADDTKTLTAYNGYLTTATKFIPTWVKVAVALALGLGTMVGWKRIVVTVGEKIGKTHMTYAQGASAELITMATILGADHLGVPVSTTHILNSGVAGTMAANRSGLQFATIRDIALAWIFTLPAAALLSGSLFYLFDKIAR
jgi:PiT family inorganic phosphate transporter